MPITCKLYVKDVTNQSCSSPKQTKKHLHEVKTTWKTKTKTIPKPGKTDAETVNLESLRLQMTQGQQYSQTDAVLRVIKNFYQE